VLIIFKFYHIAAKSAYLFLPSRPSVSSLSVLSALISTAFIGQISVKFDIREFFENLSIKSKWGLESGENIGHFT